MEISVPTHKLTPDWQKVETSHLNSPKAIRKDKQLFKGRLREAFLFSRLRYLVLRKAAYKKSGVREARYLCAKCNKLHSLKSVEVDHIIPMAYEKALFKPSISVQEAVSAFTDTFLCLDNLRVLCKFCHAHRKLEGGDT